MNPDQRAARDAWAARHGLKRSQRRHECPCALIGYRHAPYGQSQGGCALTRNWADHVSLWNYAGRPAVFVAQPYQVTGGLDRLANWAKFHGVTLKVHANSWYGFGTLQVELWAPGMHEDVCSLVREVSNA
ncbi:MAG: hypothetical protein M3N25_01840 [Actinomycetota bacterium]|nr:hypothetical protein [Actinomycetota bacterium]